RLFEQRLRLLQVDDVDAAALVEDEALHLRVPAARLVAEVNPGLQQLLHGDDCHDLSFRLLAIHRRARTEPERRPGTPVRRPRRVGGTVSRRIVAGMLADATWSDRSTAARALQCRREVARQ